MCNRNLPDQLIKTTIDFIIISDDSLPGFDMWGRLRVHAHLEVECLLHQPHQPITLVLLQWVRLATAFVHLGHALLLFVVVDGVRDGLDHLNATVCAVCAVKVAQGFPAELYHGFDNDRAA